MNIPIAYDPQVDDGHPFSNALCKRLVRVSGKPKKKKTFQWRYSRFEIGERANAFMRRRVCSMKRERVYGGIKDGLAMDEERVGSEGWRGWREGKGGGGDRIN